MMDQHPSSEAIDRWLIGGRSTETGDHLRHCAGCRAELARRESMIADFRDAAHEWTRRQPLAVPPPVWAADAGSHRRRFAPMRWAAVAVAALLAAVPLYNDYSQRQAAARASANAQLLEAVSADISRSAPEPLEPLVKLVSQSTTGETQ
jgi:hypothetical protein